MVITKLSELLKILKKNGIVLQSHGKRHDIYYNPATGDTIPIPRHAGKEIATGTAKAILKAAGLE